MQHSTSSLLKRVLASGACAAITLFGTLPAAAQPPDHARSTRTAAPARVERTAPVRAYRTYAAPARTYRAPARVERTAPVRTYRTYAAPARTYRTYSAPARTYRAPARVERTYSAPVRTYRAYRAPARVERTYSAPVRTYRAYRAPARVERTYSAPVRTYRAYRAPARVERTYSAPVRTYRTYRAPARVERTAPVRARYAVPAPFVQRVAPERNVRTTRAAAPAPFMQYVRRAPRTRETIVTRSVAASPLLRTVYAPRTRTIPVVYHPRYVVGRVASVRRNEVIIDPPTGSPVIVRDVIVGSTAPAIPVGSIVTLPVTYVNGGYQYVTPAYNSYSYNGYAPQYGYAYAPPVYCNGNSSTALYAALLPAVVGMLTGNGGNGLNSSDLASVALTAASGGLNDCSAYAPGAYYNAPAYNAPVNYGYAAPVSYSVPVTTYAAPYTTPYTTQYATTPYDNCLYSDEDGDDNGCATTPYMYNGYSSYSSYAPYTPQQVRGVVLARSGDTLMVMGANGTPTFVYAAPALQSGFAVNGPIQPGQIVDAYGYYNGNTFVATALV